MNSVTWLIIVLVGFTSLISALSITAIIGLVLGQAGLLLFRKTLA